MKRADASYLKELSRYVPVVQVVDRREKDSIIIKDPVVMFSQITEHTKQSLVNIIQMMKQGAGKCDSCDLRDKCEQDELMEHKEDAECESHQIH